MTFLHPILLGVGVACVAVPVLIHFLMRRRRRPVRWAAMRFVQEAYRQQRRRLRLEQWLLLAARCVLIGLIAVGVARPMFGGAGDAGGGGAREVYLLVDTGIASAFIGGEDGATELSRSVEGALALLDGLDAGRGDRAALISLGGPADGVVLPATADLALVERRLRELGSTDSGMDLAGGLRLVPEPDAEGEASSGRVVAVYSGFREGAVAGGSGVGGASGLAGAALVVSAPAEGLLGNVGLAGVEPLRPVAVVGGGGASGVVGVSQVRVRLVRSGVGVDAAGETAVRVMAMVEGGLREVGVARVLWEAGQASAEVLADVDLGGVRVESGGGAAGRVVLRAELPSDANERDNTAWAVVEVRERLRVAVVGTRRFGDRPSLSSFVGSDWLKLALEPGIAGASAIEVEVLDAARIGSGALAGFDAAIVAEPGRVRPEGWSTLGGFSERGGTVLLTASSTVGAQLWTEEAARSLGVPWSLGREPVELAEGEGGLRAREAGSDDLLWYIRGELDGLARSVSVARLLDVDVEDGGEVLLETSAGRPVLVVSRDGAGGGRRRGLVGVLATAVDVGWTDLPARPLMVPMVQELVRAGVGGHARGGVMTAGGSALSSGGAVEFVRWDGGGGAAGGGAPVVAVEAASGRTREPVRAAGVLLARDIEGATTGSLVVQPDALAARAGVSTRERVAASLVGGDGGGGSMSWSDGERETGGARGGAGVRSDVPGPGLMVLLAALGLACVELWLARAASHASVTGGAVPVGRFGGGSA